MNYCEIKWNDIANGPGIRVSLFVSGCLQHCPGCFNAKAWDFSYGQPYTDEIEKQIIDVLKLPYISGLSILGGDPFDMGNDTALLDLARQTKMIGKTVWCWTGHLMEELYGRPLLEYIDVLIDGPFAMEKAQAGLIWKGSSNQRIWRKEAGQWTTMLQ